MENWTRLVRFRCCEKAFVPAAGIVQYIFSLAVQGKSSTQIAKQLYEEGVTTIMQIRKPDKAVRGKLHTWSSQAVRTILNNGFYLGEMVYGKSLNRFRHSDRNTLSLGTERSIR